MNETNYTPEAVAEIKAKTAEAKARALVASRSTYDLVLDWEESDRQPMTPTMPYVRGWLLDELERRDPEAFNAWMDGNEASPRKFFVV